jgi:outer membrane scaffolding protein for murein synthesis (MipA/OmpV family)
MSEFSRKTLLVTDAARGRSASMLPALVAGISLFSSPAIADDWNIGIGAGLISAPEYLGAEDYRTRVLPAVDIAYRNRVFFNFFEGLGAYLYSRGDFRLKAGIGYQAGRDEDDDESLRGTGDIGDAAVYSLGAEYQLGLYTAFVSLRQHDGGTDGRQLHAGIQAFYALREELSSPRLLLNFTVNYSDDDYMQGYFGVDSRQTAASGLAEYSASAGIASLRAGATGIYPLTKGWRITAVVQYLRLIGDAADSPLVRDEDQLFGGVFAGYRF